MRPIHERPIDRFEQTEQMALQSLQEKPPFHQVREVQRIVQTDSCVEIDTNFYSVPWHLIKQNVIVQVVDNQVKILYSSAEVACHPVCYGTREHSIQPAHLNGIVTSKKEEKLSVQNSQPSELLRSLSKYEIAAGGNGNG